jgi:Tfp pilus assembly protein PilF
MDASAPAPHLNKGLLYFEQGEYAKAAHSLEESLAADPENSFAHLMLGVIYKDMGERDQAGEHLERYRELDGSDSRVDDWLKELGG